MVSISERVVRWGHVAIFTLVFLASVVSLAISASLVKHYNDEGYPPAHTAAWVIPPSPRMLDTTDCTDTETESGFC